jgi:tetratricopeptide (TPR) repeat protein
MSGIGDTQVFKPFSTALLSVTVLMTLGWSAAVAQPKQPQWKDGQVEYGLYEAVTKAPDAQKRLAALDAWKQKYPESDYKEPRLVTYLATYQQLNQPAKMVETAKEILALNPKEVNALMWLAYFTQTQPPTPESLDAGEKAAQGLIDAQKPETVADAAWQKVKPDFTAVGHNTLAFIATKRKQLDAAEQEYVKTIQSVTNPPCQSGIPVCAASLEAVVDWALANTIIAQKKPERYPEAIYYLARAASITGAGALPDASKKQADASLLKVYTAYHGQDDGGLKEIRTAAVSQPMPPAGFKIKAKHEVEAENEEKFAKDNPQLAMWKKIKDALVAENGSQYWESLKGSVPPKMKGKLISQKPALRPKELVLSVDEDKPQVTLKLENPLPGKAEPGTELQFEGQASEFTKDPFMLTLDVESKDKIEGWPAQAAPPARKGPPRKKQH